MPPTAACPPLLSFLPPTAQLPAPALLMSPGEVCKAGEDVFETEVLNQRAPGHSAGPEFKLEVQSCTDTVDSMVMPQPVKTRLMAKEISTLAGVPWLRRRAFWSAWPVVLPGGPGTRCKHRVSGRLPHPEMTRNSPGLVCTIGHRQTDGRSGTEPTVLESVSS